MQVLLLMMVHLALKSTCDFPQMDYMFCTKLDHWLWVTIDVVSNGERNLAEFSIEKYEANATACPAYPKWHIVIPYHSYIEDNVCICLTNCFIADERVILVFISSERRNSSSREYIQYYISYTT